MKLIALGAYKGTGKTAVAEALTLLHNFVRISFADPLYDMVLAGFGIDGRSMTTAEKEQQIEWLGVSLRHILQTLGTEWGRNTICQDIWLRVASRKILAHQKAGRDVVIDDARFPNEGELVQSMGGTVFHLYRKEVAIRQYDTHTSEQGIGGLPDVVRVEVLSKSDPANLRLHLRAVADRLVSACPPMKSS